MPGDDYGAPQTGPSTPARTQEETADEPRGGRPSREELEERSRRMAESRKPAGPAQDEPSDVPPTPPPGGLPTPAGDYGAPQAGPDIPARTQEETAGDPRGGRPSREELEERSRRIGESRKPAGPAQDQPSDVPPTPPPDLAR